jgi:hypothetical protein
MNRFRIGIILFAVIVIIGQLTVLDYGNLIWSRNAGSYLGIISMICIIISMILSNRHEKRKLEREN